MTTREAALREKRVEAKLLAENVLDSFKTGDVVRMDCVESARRLLAALATPPSPVEEAMERLSLGCQSHGCRIRKPQGMATNGPCQCLEKLRYEIAALDVAGKVE